MQYLKIMKYVILIYWDSNAKIMFSMLFFTYNGRFGLNGFIPVCGTAYS